jgi:hypothetical protein
LTPHGFGTLLTSEFYTGRLTVKKAKVDDGERHAEGHAERAERWGHEEGDHESHDSHGERRKGSSAQEAWKGICGKVF